MKDMTVRQKAGAGGEKVRGRCDFRVRGNMKIVG